MANIYYCTKFDEIIFIYDGDMAKIAAILNFNKSIIWAPMNFLWRIENWVFPLTSEVTFTTARALLSSAVIRVARVNMQCNCRCRLKKTLDRQMQSATDSVAVEVPSYDPPTCLHWHTYHYITS